MTKRDLGEIDFLMTLDQTNYFLELAIFFGWITDEYEGVGGIKYYLDKPYKWQREYNYAIAWAKNNLDTDGILMIMEGNNATRFLEDFHLIDLDDWEGG